MDQRIYDPFDKAMYPTEAPSRRRRKGRAGRFVLRVLALFLIMMAAGFSSLCMYLWFTGRQVDLTGRPVTFHQIRADRENALSVPQVYDRCRPWVVSLEVYGSGAGTGIVLTGDGYILTCAHVIDGEPLSIIAETADGTRFDARVVAMDRQTDVGVLKIDALGMDPAQLGDSSQVLVGETAIALGNPLGRQYASTLTAGYISARERTVTIENYMMTLLQFDAAVSPGNSGGPLLNSLGQVIGLINAKVDQDHVEGIGFAIPIDLAARVAEDLIEHGFVQQRPWLGITVQDYSGVAGMNAPGVLVADISEGSAALAAGLQVGDWIVAFNGVSTPNAPLLNFEKDKCAVGDTVVISVLRDNQWMELECILGPMPGDTAQ